MDKSKYNLILTDGAKQQLKSLQQRTDAASFAEVIRRALSVYDALYEYASGDWEIVLRNKKKNIEKPVILV
jgi:hypothetical protein